MFAQVSFWKSTVKRLSASISYRAQYISTLDRAIISCWYFCKCNLIVSIYVGDSHYKSQKFGPTRAYFSHDHQLYDNIVISHMATWPSNLFTSNTNNKLLQYFLAVMRYRSLCSMA